MAFRKATLGSKLSDFEQKLSQAVLRSIKEKLFDHNFISVAFLYSF